MSEGRKLPVKNGDHPGFGRMEQQIADPEIAVAERHETVIGRQIGNKPAVKVLDRLDRAGRRGPVLSVPARDLAMKVGAGFAEIAKAHRIGTNRVHRGHRVGDRHPDAAPLSGW